jgi:protein TonB
MICYIIPFRGNRQPDVSGTIVPLEAPGFRWGPLSRRRQNWRAALVGTALLHLLAICPALLLIAHVGRPNSPADLAVEMVFAEPAPAQPELSQQPPTPQNAETPSPPAQITQPPDQPAPPVPEAPQQPPTPPASFDSSQSDAPATPTPAEKPEPLPVPPPAPPPASARQASIPRKAFAPPRRVSPGATASPDWPSSVSPAAEPTPPSSPATTVSGAWRQALAAWLAEHKTYPDEARRQGIEGNVTLRFGVDRSGHVIEVTVLRGSGSGILDSAAETMLSNAMLPPPEPAIQDRITISVQVHYKLAN